MLVCRGVSEAQQSSSSNMQLQVRAAETRRVHHNQADRSAGCSWFSCCCAIRGRDHLFSTDFISWSGNANFQCERFMSAPVALWQNWKKRMSWLPTGANVASVQLHHCCICGCFSVSTLTDDSSCRKKTVWLEILQKQPSVVKISDLQWMKSTYTRRARTCWWRGILKGDACFWKYLISRIKVPLGCSRSKVADWESYISIIFHFCQEILWNHLHRSCKSWLVFKGPEVGSASPHLPVKAFLFEMSCAYFNLNLCFVTWPQNNWHAANWRLEYRTEESDVCEHESNNRSTTTQKTSRNTEASSANRLTERHLLLIGNTCSPERLFAVTAV